MLFIAFLFCATRNEGYITAFPCSRVGDFDTFDNYFLPWGGDFDNFFRKCQHHHPMPAPPTPRA